MVLMVLMVCRVCRVCRVFVPFKSWRSKKHIQPRGRGSETSRMTRQQTSIVRSFLREDAPRAVFVQTLLQARLATCVLFLHLGDVCKGARRRQIPLFTEPSVHVHTTPSPAQHSNSSAFIVAHHPRHPPSPPSLATLPRHPPSPHSPSSTPASRPLRPLALERVLARAPRLVLG